MKTLPTHSSAQAAFTPILEKPKYQSQPSLLWELGHFFTQHCCRRPYPTTHLLGPECVAAIFYMRSCCGSPIPLSCPLWA